MNGVHIHMKWWHIICSVCIVQAPYCWRDALHQKLLPHPFYVITCRRHVWRTRISYKQGWTMQQYFINHQKQLICFCTFLQHSAFSPDVDCRELCRAAGSCPRRTSSSVYWRAGEWCTPCRDWAPLLWRRSSRQCTTGLWRGLSAWWTLCSPLWSCPSDPLCMPRQQLSDLAKMLLRSTLSGKQMTLWQATFWCLHHTTIAGACGRYW